MENKAEDFNFMVFHIKDKKYRIKFLTAQDLVLEEIESKEEIEFPHIPTFVIGYYRYYKNGGLTKKFFGAIKKKIRQE